MSQKKISILLEMKADRLTVTFTPSVADEILEKWIFTLYDTNEINNEVWMQIGEKIISHLKEEEKFFRDKGLIV